jgi:tetratricopeptide (TPR) repeat protein
MAAGVAAYQQGKYAEAEKQWVAAVKEAEGFGPQDPRLAASLNRLGEVHLHQRRYAEAEPLIKRALAIRQKALGPKNPDVAMSLHNLALLYKAQGRYSEAEPLYQQALAIFEKALGPDHSHVATSLARYAALLRKTGRSAEATRMEARAKAIRARHAEQNPASSASAKTLHDYAAAGDIDQVKRLVTDGANLDAKDKSGRTPLHYAAFANRKGMVELLVTWGANHNTKDKDGFTPLHWAGATLPDVGVRHLPREELAVLREEECGTPAFTYVGWLNQIEMTAAER